MENQKYKDWITLRSQSIDEDGEKLCYCGHTYKCTCGDPDETLFEYSVSNGTIILDDINNGWKVSDAPLEDDDGYDLFVPLRLIEK